MNRPRHFLTGMLVASGVLSAVTGCVPGQVDSHRAERPCSVHEDSGAALDIAGLKLKVSRIRKDHVACGTHGVGLKLGRVRVTLGSHPLYLVGTEGGRADFRIR